MIESVDDVSAYPAARLGIVSQTTATDRHVVSIRSTGIARAKPGAEIKFIEDFPLGLFERDLDHAQMLRAVERRDSPVVPQGTRKSIPASICRRTNFRSAASSSDPSLRKGVTNAVPQPVNIISLLTEQDIFEFEDAKLAGHPLRGLQRAAREAFSRTSRMAQRDGVRRRIEPDLVRPGCAPARLALVSMACV